jgi:hypothetical protein
MAEYLSTASHRDQAINLLAYCTVCKAVFANIKGANDHELGCTASGVP